MSALAGPGGHRPRPAPACLASMTAKIKIAAPMTPTAICRGGEITIQAASSAIQATRPAPTQRWPRVETGARRKVRTMTSAGHTPTKKNRASPGHRQV